MWTRLKRRLCKTERSSQSEIALADKRSSQSEIASANRRALESRCLALEQEIQGLRLELEGRERVLMALKTDLGRQRNDEGVRVIELAQAQMERILTDVAAPIAQLLTQAYLLEIEGKPVQSRDVLAVVRQLVRALEDAGLALEGSVGETVTFNPNRQEPLSVNASLTPGEKVMVRFVGVTYRDKLLRKAGVERVRGDGWTTGS